MGDKTGISWTDATWNPVTGCTKVSAGCKHCYAERDWSRLVHLPAYKGRDFSDVVTHPFRLYQPMRWASPRRIFVNSMSDLFHPSVPDAFIDQVFAAMALTPRHQFQVLTKRPERMRDSMRRIGRSAAILDAAARALGYTLEHGDKYLVQWPLPNVWLGVSVEDQETADGRIPILLQTPASVRWISAEPLLGPIDLTSVEFPCYSISADVLGGCDSRADGGLTRDITPGNTIDWVVVGGESGPKARPMHPDWARSLRDQCADAGVAFFFKQWGEWAPNCLCHRDKACATIKRPEPGKLGVMFRCGKKAAGNMLDDVVHGCYPEVAK